MFAEPGGGLSFDDLDRCRRDYTLEQYRGEACVIGLDPGRVLHVVIRECPSEPRVSQSFYVPLRSIPQGSVRSQGSPASRSLVCGATRRRP